MLQMGATGIQASKKQEANVDIHSTTPILRTSLTSYQECTPSRVRVTLRLAVYRQSVLGDKPLETHDQYFFSKLNTCGHSPYATSSLTRKWVCRLQLLLVLASAVILGSKSRGTRDHILLFKFETPPTCRARSPYLYPPGTGWPRYTPRHWVPFSSPPTTRRVEVFESASTTNIFHALYI
jgi:hypothetical protein